MRKEFLALPALVLLPLGIWQKTRLEVISQDMSVFFQSVILSRVSAFLQNLFARIQLVTVSPTQAVCLLAALGLVLGLFLLRAHRRFDDNPGW